MKCILILHILNRNGFEIKCLSNKKSITIDTVTIYAKDNPIALKHRSSI